MTILQRRLSSFLLMSFTLSSMLVATFSLAAVFSNAAQAAVGEKIKYLPVQDGGRLKPYDTFARETLKLIYGKDTYEGKPATEVIFTWMLSPEAWQQKPIFEVRNREVLKGLALEEKRYFTGEEVFGSDRFVLLRQELQAKRESKEKLTPYFQALQRIENQFFIFQEVASGRMLRVMPPAEGTQWLSVAELTGEAQEEFVKLSKAFVNVLGAQTDASRDLATVKAELDTSVDNFMQMAQKANPEAYAKETKIRAEVHYNQFHPFRWAYIIYAIATFLMLLGWSTARNQVFKAGFAIAVLGFLLHTYGFGLRIFLTERPPVSNMYETVVWVSWGAMIFGAVLEAIYKFRFVIAAATLVASFSLIVADTAPIVLDPSIAPLEAVLRSNYWLIIHVMPITVSYAAFFLAFALGDIGLIYYLRGEEKHKKTIKDLSQAIYRSMQIGVVFLAPGIILGGIWADYSWGRFWGWDPKETWALIALLGYLAVMHGRLGGFIRDFGMIATGVVSFSLVIMAWYGVNFVLGAGLHSYGFGAGGLEYVAGFILFHFLFVGYTYSVYSRRRKTLKTSAK